MRWVVGGERTSNLPMLCAVCCVLCAVCCVLCAVCWGKIQMCQDAEVFRNERASTIVIMQKHTLLRCGRDASPSSI